MLRAIVAEPVKLPSVLRPQLPPALETLIQRCLKKDPARRFQHMDDVQVELLEIAEETNSLPAVGSTSPARTRRWSSLAAGAALALVVATVAIVVYVREQGSWTSTPSGSPRLTQLTAYAGAERFPSFSPDGSYVAFAWTGEDGGNTDIYVKAVDGTTASPRRLTTNPAVDTVPSWSPDGRSIAFCRTMTPTDGAPHVDVMIVPALGGPERRIGSVAVSTRPALSWTPDGRWIATPDTDTSGRGGIFLIPVSQGERRRLTSNPRYMDAWPAVSPDGRWLAYGACSGVWACDVHVQPLGADYQPKGEPQRLTAGGLGTDGISWTADSQEVVYAASRYGPYGALYLWRQALSPGSEPRRIELANRGAAYPAVSRAGHVLAFSQSLGEGHLWRILDNESPRPLTESTKYEASPDLSPDSKRLVFSSNRASDEAELFVSDWDGANPVQITDRLGREQSSPRWSPDGQRIVFDSQTERGDWDLFVIDASGGAPRLVSSTPFAEGAGSWSRDGRFIYFSSDRSGRPEIWRVPAAGGREVQVTDAGGLIGLEAYDGRTFYYVKTRTSPQPLFARTLGSAAERKVVDGLMSRTFAVDEKGVFYFAAGPRQGTASLRHVDNASGEVREVAHLDVLPTLGLTASRDGRMIFFSAGRPAADLYVIENFR